MTNVYERVYKAGIPIDSHESDLYVSVCERAKLILKDYDYLETVTIFRSLTDGRLWYDIPFAYEPWWLKRLAVSC